MEYLKLIRKYLQHSCYDGTISVSYVLYVQLSCYEVPEPDWDDQSQISAVPFKELNFKLDDTLKKEIKRMMKECDDRVSFIYKF